MQGPVEEAPSFNYMPNAEVSAICRLRGENLTLEVMGKMREVDTKFSMLGDVGPFLRGLRSKLYVDRPRKIGLVLGRMESRVSALNELVRMRSGVYLMRVASRESGEEIDHCFSLDANLRVILDGAEDCAIKLSNRTIGLCGMDRKGLHVAEALVIH